MADETYENGEIDEAEAEAKAAPPPMPPPPNTWLSVNLGMAGAIVALASAVFLTGQYLKTRPLDLRAKTLDAAREVEERLLSNRIPKANFTVHTEPIEGDTVSYNYVEYDIALPRSVDSEGLQRVLHRALQKKGVNVARTQGARGEPILELSLAGHDFGFVRIEQRRESGPASRIEWPDLQDDAERSPSPAPTPTGSPEHPPRLPALESEPPLQPPEEAPEPPAEPEVASSVEVPLDVAPDAPAEPAGTAPPASETTQVAHWIPPAGEQPPVEATGLPVISHGLMKVAIIIDDGGYGGETTERILALDPRLTLSILPYTPKARELATRAAELGFEIMLHMPMDNLNPALKHDGQLEVGMSPARIHALTLRAMDYVPGAVGINNHMGSRFTSDALYMQLFLEGIEDLPLFFIDSRTSSISRAYDLAAEMEIPAAYRHIFLDHDNDPEAIRNSFRAMMAMAEEQGEVVAIAHFRPNTAAVLTEMLPMLDEAGIDLVHASEIVQ